MQSTYRILLDIQYPTSERHTMTLYPSDMLYTRIEYSSAYLYNTYTIYISADVRWDVINYIMSSYYLHNYRILGLNGVSRQHCRERQEQQQQFYQSPTNYQTNLQSLLPRPPATPLNAYPVSLTGESQQHTTGYLPQATMDYGHSRHQYMLPNPQAPGQSLLFGGTTDNTNSELGNF